jgi:hypothetical protein
MRFHPKDLQRVFFFSERFSRVLDASGYATLMRWRLYGEEALAGKEADLWSLRTRSPSNMLANPSQPTRSPARRRDPLPTTPGQIR